MEILNQFVPDILIIIFGIAGFLVARFIGKKKEKKKKLICPMRANCDTVVNSRYSKLFGIPLERLGMAYYTIIAITHGIHIAFPALFSPETILALLILSTAAFLFSLYLIHIQMFIIRQWCSWCLLSAFFCLSIFCITFFSFPF